MSGDLTDSRIRQATRSLEWAIEELQGDIRKIREHLDELDTGHSEFEDTLSNLRDGIDELESTASTLDDTVEDLDLRITALERWIRVTSGAETADLEAADPALLSAARTARAGRRAAASLLTNAQRAAHTHTLELYHQALKRGAAAHTAVLDACDILASTPPTEKRHREAAAAYRAALEQEEDAAAAADRYEQPATAAQATLATDDQRRKANASAIALGEQAEHTLTVRLRTRIADALNDGHLLPVWFTTALGPLPPSRRTEQWLNAAAHALAYRITYGVTDQVLLLGPSPTGNTARDQLADHARTMKILRTARA